MTLNEIIKLTEGKPRFTHDCDHCRYLGQYGEFDLYVHPQVDPDRTVMETLIARESSSPGDYRSGGDFSILFPAPHPLREALMRALATGFKPNSEMKSRAWDLWAYEQLKSWSETPKL